MGEMSVEVAGVVFAISAVAIGVSALIIRTATCAEKTCDPDSLARGVSGWATHFRKKSRNANNL